MPTSYSDLSLYRQCPRLFGFRKLGYTPPTVSEPLQTGTFVHAGIAAHFRGQDPHEIVDDLYHSMADQYDLASDEIKDLMKAHTRYKDLLARYLKSWVGDYKATLIEPELELDGVVCHPDLIGFYQTNRVIVDYKTSYHPDDRWYDMSGQADLYAYIIRQKAMKIDSSVDLIIYDVISEEGIYRHIRPPRLTAGKRLFRSIQKLNEDCEWVSEADKDFHIQTAFLANPHPDYTCPSRCHFFTPCWLLDTDSLEAVQDYLSENFIKKER